MAQQLATVPSSATTAASSKASQSKEGKTNWVVTTIFVIALIFFFGPWVAAAVFGFTRPGDGFTFEPLLSAFENPRAMSAVIDTLLLALATTLLMLVLLVPTIVFLNLKSPKLARIAELLSVLPLVIPAVALVSGVSEFYRAVAPSFLVSKWSLRFRCVIEQLMPELKLWILRPCLQHPRRSALHQRRPCLTSYCRTFGFPCFRLRFCPSR